MQYSDDEEHSPIKFYYILEKQMTQMLRVKANADNAEQNNNKNSQGKSVFWSFLQSQNKLRSSKAI